MPYIYKISTTKSNKVYIGQTSRSVKPRFKEHIEEASKSKHSKGLYAAIQKYGIDSFSIDILEECAKEDLDDKERFWIKEYDSFHNGYNLTAGGQGRIPNASDEEIIDYYLQNKENKTITQIAQDLHVGFNRVRDLLSDYGLREKRDYSLIDKEEIEAMVSDHYNGLTIGALSKKYHRDAKVIKKAFEKNNIETIVCSSDIKKKPIVQLSLKGKYIRTWESGYAARKYFNNKHITEVANGKRKTAAGFKWIWEEDYLQ